MAKTFPLYFSLSAVLLLLLGGPSAAGNHRFSRTLSPATLKPRREKLSHLHFFLHETISGPHPSAMRIAEAASTNSSATLFGVLVMTDDPLRVGPDRASKIVGRAQGMYGSASHTEVGIFMDMSLAFMDGKFNGSNLVLLGRNAGLHAVREIPIAGGSGLFRFARGYAEARTHTFDFETGDAIVEYHVYVLHY